MMKFVKNGVSTDDMGGTYWRKDGLLHREDGPAVEYTNGTKQWWINGEHHREDGPAVINVSTGTNLWYLNGEPSTEEFVMNRWNAMQDDKKSVKKMKY